ncbi:hypothetical protein DMUE_2891 [Dictyocoela muelleri]|nr:hypothetical protein DMUE_2891 [Dictyocoela muelleri]
MAPYAIKAAKNLKDLFPNLKHVTCLCHVLHLVCEKLRNISPVINLIASDLKRVLIKNKENRALFKNITGLKMPAFPVITRWGTWLDFMVNIAKEYRKYEMFLRKLSEIDTNYSFLVESFSSKDFIQELSEILNCEYLSCKITKLQRNDLSAKDQCKIIKEVRSCSQIPR